MKTSAQGLIDIAYHEGICLQPYLDSVNVWTIGLGHTAMAGPPDPQSVKELTIKEAFDLLKADIVKYEAPVIQFGPKDLAQHEFDALVSFCFNVGPGNLRSLVNNRTKQQIGQNITAYSRAGTNATAVLERRRMEQKTFQQCIYARPQGTVPVIPVIGNRPAYSKSRLVDVRPYVIDGNAPVEAPAPVASGDPYVIALQTALNKTINAGLVIDGDYGPKTRGSFFSLDKSNVSSVLASIVSLAPK